MMHYPGEGRIRQSSREGSWGGGLGGWLAVAGAGQWGFEE